MDRSTYYTYRAVIFEMDHNGDSPRLPAEISGKSRGFMVSAKHQYVAVLYGLKRDHTADVVNMVSSDDPDQLHETVSWVPLVFNKATGQVFGPLRFRYAVFSVAASRYARKVVSPMDDTWMINKNLCTLADARETIDRVRNRDIRAGKHNREFKIIRVSRRYKSGKKANRVFIHTHLLPDNGAPWLV